MKSTKNKKPSIKIYEKVEFQFGHYHNVQRVALALGMAGYYIKIIDNEPTYTLLVYTTKET